MTVRYSRDSRVDRTLRHSVRDGVAYSVMSGGAETYLSAFALFLKASAPQVAMLATLPPLLASLAQPLSVWFGRRLRRRKPVILAGACIQALVWVPLMLLPLRFPEQAVPILIACITLYHMGGNLAAPLWSSLMGDLVPDRKRGRFFGRRTRLATISAFLALVASGVVLDGFDRWQWPWLGFMAIFSMALLARLVSLYHLGRMHEPEPEVQESPLPRYSWHRFHSAHAWRFTLFVAGMQGAVAVAAPFFAVYMLRDLQFSYLQFMANTGMAVLVQFFTLNTWGRISDAFGNRLILTTTGILIPVLPALWLVSDSFGYLLGIQVISGLAWAGFSLSTGNFLYELVPARRRADYMALHNMLVAVSIFAGGMLGALFSKLLSVEFAAHAWGGALLGVFALSALLRALVALWFLPRLEEVRKPRRSLSTRQLVFRVTRFNAFSGLLYEAVAGFRRATGDKGGEETTGGVKRRT